MFVILFYHNLMKFLGDGPLWYGIQQPTTCGKYWWTNLLYINNFHPNSLVKEVSLWPLLSNFPFVTCNSRNNWLGACKILLQSWTKVLTQTWICWSVFKSHILNSFSHPHKQRWTRVSRIFQHWLRGWGSGENCKVALCYEGSQKLQGLLHHSLKDVCSGLQILPRNYLVAVNFFYQEGGGRFWWIWNAKKCIT